MRQLIADLLKKALAEEGVELTEEEIAKFIEIPPSVEMGDYAFPCFFLAPKFKENPHAIAIKLRENIGNPPKEFEDIQTAGAYINFFLNRKEFAKNLISEILTKKEDFGKTDIGKGEKVILEHTSLNPNSSPHVGRARNAIIGDSLARILRFFGFKTEVHYYVNDVSKQIAMLVLAKAERLKFESMLNKYVEIAKKVSKSKKLEKEVFELLQRFEQKDKDVVERFKKITKTCIEGQKKILLKLGIKYDVFDYESDYIGSAKKVLSELEKTGKLFKDKEGRAVLDLKGTVLENKMKSPVLVLTRSDGTGLYPLRDIAYTIHKLKSAKRNIIVLGEDQKLYFLQIKEALKLLGFNAPEVVHYSFILIHEEGKRKKMSTRKGDVVLLEDFLEKAVKKAKKNAEERQRKGSPEKIGIGSVKYAIIKNSPNRSIAFSLDEALNFEGDTGPYLLYSYARASSIIRKAKRKEKTEKTELKEVNIEELDLKEIELVKKLSQFPEVVLSAYNNLNPSLIANYSYQLAQIFNEFYHSCPVMQSHQKEFRLALVESFRTVLKNSLWLLGIETIEEM